MTAQPSRLNLTSQATPETPVSALRAFKSAANQTIAGSHVAAFRVDPDNDSGFDQRSHSVEKMDSIPRSLSQESAITIADATNKTNSTTVQQKQSAITPATTALTTAKSKYSTYFTTLETKTDASATATAALDKATAAAIAGFTTNFASNKPALTFTDEFTAADAANTFVSGLRSYLDSLDPTSRLLVSGRCRD